MIPSRLHWLCRRSTRFLYASLPCSHWKWPCGPCMVTGGAGRARHECPCSHPRYIM